MSEAKFEYHDLRLVEPTFGSKLTDFIIELEHLRKKRLGGTTHARVFFQLKHIFHTLESIGSARIVSIVCFTSDRTTNILTYTLKICCHILSPLIKESLFSFI